MKFIDLIFAVTVLIAGCFTLYSALDRIQHIEKPSNVLMDDIALGKSALYVKYHDECIGKIDVELNDGKSPFLKIYGNLAASLKQKIIQIPLSMTAFFNPLGQMTDFQFKIEAENVQIIFKGQQVKPIAVEFQILGLAKDISLEYALPGPILLKSINEKFKRIIWEGELPFASLNLGMISSNTQSKKIQFDTSLTEGETCEQAIELDTFLSMVPKLMQKFKTLDISTFLSGQMPSSLGLGK